MLKPKPKIVTKSTKSTQTEITMAETTRDKNATDNGEPKFKRLKTSEGPLVLTVGQGQVGQLGLGPDIEERNRFTVVPDLEDVMQIIAGGMHTVCLTTKGQVYTFGCDDEGALGRKATDEDYCIPRQVNLESSAMEISAGDSHTAALLDTGKVYLWGTFRDSHGSMGLTSAGIERTPVLVDIDEPVTQISSGADHFLMLTKSGKLYSCGCPEQGQLGRIPEASAKRENSEEGLAPFLEPRQVEIPFNIVEIWATTYGSFVSTDNKDMYVFGLNNYYQLGLDTEGPVFEPTKSFYLSGNYDWAKVAGGEHHTVLLDSDNKVYSIGRKEYGRLGLGNIEEDVKAPKIVPKLSDVKTVDIASGSTVSYAVTDTGACYGWGMGTNGQLGRGLDFDDVLEPELLTGRQLSDRQIIGVAAGGQHAACLAKAIETQN